MIPQLFTALAWWTGTLGQPPEAPAMQPRAASLTFIERMANAVHDLDSLHAVREAQRRHEDPIAAILGVEPGKVLYRGKVADVEGPSTADGADVHQWGYVGALNQHWRLSAAP